MYGHQAKKPKIDEKSTKTNQTFASEHTCDQDQMTHPCPQCFHYKLLCIGSADIYFDGERGWKTRVGVGFELSTDEIGWEHVPK